MEGFLWNLEEFIVFSCWCFTRWFNLIRYFTIQQNDTIWFEKIQFDTIRYYLIRFVSEQLFCANNHWLTFFYLGKSNQRLLGASYLSFIIRMVLEIWGSHLNLHEDKVEGSYRENHLRAILYTNLGASTLDEFYKIYWKPVVWSLVLKCVL